jgi:hypothetical protein
MTEENKPDKSLPAIEAAVSDATEGQHPAAAPVVTPSTLRSVPIDESKEIKIKVRKPKQRACDERNAKGKLCGGHLKRWYGYPPEVAKKIGKDAEIYRCEFCKTLYKPDPKQILHSFTQRY